MKRHLLLLLAPALLMLPLPVSAQTPFSYQGKLDNAGTAYTGTVTIRLGLYTAATGLSPLRTETISNVSVTTGIFTVTPATFTAADFPGAARWLQIEVSTDGLTFTPLTPRQQITHSPYAIYATQAGTAATVTGNVPGSQITGFVSPSRLDTGTTTGTINFNPAAGAPFAVGSAIKVTNLNGDLLDGLDSTAFLRTSGGTLSGNLALTSPAAIGFGNTTRQMLNLYNADYGLGIQGNTLYQRSSSRFSWFAGGIHSDTENTPGTGGTTLMTLTSTSLATSVPITGTSTSLVVAAISGQGADNGYGGRFVCNGSSGWAVNGVSDTGFAGQFSGKVNITGNTTLGANLSVSGNTTLTGTINVTGTSTFSNEVTSQGAVGGFAVKNRNDQNKRWVMYSRNSGATDQLAFYSGATGDVAALSPNGDMYLVGALSTTVLTIRGGADVAEPFAMTKPDELEPGTVVIIDEENPGKLKLSTKAHDTRVAGIISGAGGVKPGLRLHQEGVLEGDHHVALSGRVYVKADATAAAIRPGDLLTTSATPGHAMKVRDHDKAQGAILGKAMSALPQGSTGLVLVLVTLQ